MAQSVLTIGTEYVDRKMLGTGVEDDPWIIGNDDTDTDENMFKNFLDAIYTDNAYVKLERDIDVSKSFEYREGINHIIVICCSKLYSDGLTDNSGRKAIKNLVIRNTTDNQNYRNYIELKNDAKIEYVQFLNWYFAGNDNMSCIITINNNTTNNCIKFCDLSFMCNCFGASSVPFSTKANSSTGTYLFTNCSIYYKVINYSTVSSCIFGTHSSGYLGFHKCNIYYDGPITNSSGVVGYLLFNAYRTSVFGNVTSKTSTGNQYIFGDCTNCYFAGNVLSSNTVQIMDSDSTCLICDTANDSTKITYRTPSIVVTPDELKSKERLYELGFLP